jgi:hypothetical protein
VEISWEAEKDKGKMDLMGVDCEDRRLMKLA